MTDLHLPLSLTLSCASISVNIKKMPWYIFIKRATVLKVPVAESLPGPIKPVGTFLGGVLTFLTLAMLGVRAFTSAPDARYIDNFPTGM